MSLVAALLLGVAPAAAADTPSGLYRSNQMEIGAALELQPGGRFFYALDYGAVSEGAEGDWTFDGTTIRLTSKQSALDGERSAAEFRGQPLVRDGDLLLLHRYETVIRFEPVRPGEE